MYIKYDEYDLLELFGREPVIVTEYEEAGVFDYKTGIIDGFELSMYMSIYEQLCCISLQYMGFLTPIFDFTVYYVEKITKRDNSLIISNCNNDKVIIYFKPHISLKMEYGH